MVDSIGVNVHAGHYLGYGGVSYDDWNAIINIVGDLGIRYVRDQLPDPDRLNQLTAATGAKVVAICEMQDTSSGVLKLNQSRLGEVMDKARSLTGLAYIEGPNEYDGYPDPNWYADLLQWQSSMYALAKGDPVLRSKPVIAPSLYGLPQYSAFQAYCDRGNIHSYPAGGIWTDYLQGAINGAHYVAGADAPIVATETGYNNGYLDPSNGYGVTENASAKYIPRLLMEYYHSGIEKTFLYELADDNPDPRGDSAWEELHFGLVRYDLTYKPAAVRVKNLIAQLSDPGESFTPGKLDCTISGGDENLHHLLLQKRDGSYVLALWQNVKVYDNANRVEITNPTVPVTVSLSNFVSAGGQLFDLSSMSALSSYGAGVISFGLNVPDEVMLLKLTPAPATPHAWTTSGDGVWSIPSNWSGSSVPAGAFAAASFGTAGSSPHNVTVGASGANVGAITFDSAAPYTIGGSGTLVIDTPAFGAIKVLQASHAITAPLSIVRDTTIDVSAGAQLNVTNLSVGSDVYLTKSGAGAAVVNRVRGARGLHVTGGTLTIADNASASGVSDVSELTISGGGKLDLRNNSFVVRSAIRDAGAWNGSAYDGLTGLIASGRGAVGAWNGSGIVTTMSDAVDPNSLTSLGVARAGDALLLADGETSAWRGQTVSASDLLIGYTYGGDANLDGTINGDDYFQIDSAFAQGLHGWFNGDFDYDGTINGDDYFLIDSNFARQGLPLGGSAAGGIAVVPEPSMAAAVALVTLSWVTRRRRAGVALQRPRSGRLQRGAPLVPMG